MRRQNHYHITVFTVLSCLTLLFPLQLKVNTGKKLYSHHATFSVWSKSNSLYLPRFFFVSHRQPLPSTVEWEKQNVNVLQFNNLSRFFFKAEIHNNKKLSTMTSQPPSPTIRGWWRHRLKLKIVISQKLTAHTLIPAAQTCTNEALTNPTICFDVLK